MHPLTIEIVGTIVGERESLRRDRIATARRSRRESQPADRRTGGSFRVRQAV
ncbi:MAG TPA: hypothetical protein VLD62_00105 [Acidimicrobiia bacterium]|nr:hypothetical protein [Acidimicrobiia bacterium]